MNCWLASSGSAAAVKVKEPSLPASASKILPSCKTVTDLTLMLLTSALTTLTVTFSVLFLVGSILYAAVIVKSNDPIVSTSSKVKTPLLNVTLSAYSSGIGVEVQVTSWLNVTGLTRAV